MELIVFPLALIYFIRLHLREKKEAELRAPLEIAGDAVIERDASGNITVIRISLS